MINLFSIIATLLFCCMNLFVLKSFQLRFSSLNLLFIAIFVVVTAFQGLYFFTIKAHFITGNLYKILISTIAISFILFLFCIVFNLLDLGLNRTNFSFERREFLTRIFDISLVILSFSYLFKGFFNTFKEPFINKVDIKIKNLKSELKLAVLSDIHLGEFLGKEFLEILVSKVKSQNANALLIVGDMFDLKASDLKDILSPLKSLEIPIFFVTGNHEYYMGASDLIGALKKIGVRVLENESVEFGGVNLAGVLDIDARFDGLKPDIKEALSKTDPKIPTILMAHQPKFVNQNFEKSVDLYICGHTHAGQIFPFSFFVWLDQKYVYGLYKKENSQIYVSSGAGFWGPPIRILAPAEIAILNLKKA